MKKYPPRRHDKKKRVSKKDWPSFLLHPVREPTWWRAPHPWRPRKGIITIKR